MNTGSTWFGQAMTATLFLIPGWLAIGFFERNFQVKPDVFLVWYALGMAITATWLGESPLQALVTSWRVVGMILLVGFTVGGVANILLFQAVGRAPNPGLPVAIASAASVGVFLVGALLSVWLPRYFDSVKVDAWSLIGLVLTITGVSIISIRR